MAGLCSQYQTALVWYAATSVAVLRCMDVCLLKADAGLLTFSSGQQHTQINVTILRSADSTEGDRTFDVELLNPSGGVGIGIASTVSVTLLAGTRAFGVFYFADQSLSVVVAEDSGSPVVEATFEVTSTSIFIYIFITSLALVRSVHSTSGVCVCCLASNGTNLYGMMYGG